MSTRQFSDELISRLGRINAAIEADEGLTSEIGAMPSSLFLATGLTPPMVPSTVAEDVSPLVKELCQKRCQAFARIVQCLSDQYGHGDIETLSADQLSALMQEAHDLAERWEEDEPVEGWVCDTELKRLLQAHSELGVDIVTLDDEDYDEDDDEPAG